MAPAISVLMPVYNAELYVGEAIESILAQTFDDYEFIIVDDCSSDSSLNIIKSYSDQRIKVIENQENLGISGSLNKGLEVASGKYIARFDADDISSTGRLKVQYDFLEQNLDAAIAGTWIDLIDKSGDFIRTQKFEIKDFGDFVFGLFTKNPRLAHPALMIRKSAILEVKGYSPCKCEDYDLWVKIAKCHYSARIIHQAALKYRCHDSQYTSDDNIPQSTNANEIHFSIINEVIDDNETSAILCKLLLNSNVDWEELSKSDIDKVVILSEKLIMNVKYRYSFSESEYNSFVEKFSCHFYKKSINCAVYGNISIAYSLYNIFLVNGISKYKYFTMVRFIIACLHPRERLRGLFRKLDS
jgi:glycosyltransferase involved in cell wall biosynthesis